MPLFLSVLVSQKPTWRDHPFLKDKQPCSSDPAPPASSKETEQLYFKPTSEELLSDLWEGEGGRGGAQPPLHLPVQTVAVITSVVKKCVCVRACVRASESCSQRTPPPSNRREINDDRCVGVGGLRLECVTAEAGSRMTGAHRAMWRRRREGGGTPARLIANL
ncbi:hypothetical protein PAMA_014528 [Pampus argenteus]